MTRRIRYSPEVKERAVRMVFDQQAQHESQWSAISSIASKIDCTRETEDEGAFAGAGRFPSFSRTLRRESPKTNPIVSVMRHHDALMQDLIVKVIGSSRADFPSWPGAPKTLLTEAVDMFAV